MLGAVLVCSSSGWAHQITGVNVGTVVELNVGSDDFKGTYALQYGELSGFDERKRMDLDRDGTISAAEQERHLQQLARQLTSRLILEVDGERQSVQLEKGQMLPAETKVLPEQLTLQFEVVVDPIDFTEARQLIFRDENDIERVVHADISIIATDELDIHQPLAPLKDNALRQVLVRAPQGPVQAEVTLKPAAGLWRTTPSR